MGYNLEYQKKYQRIRYYERRKDAFTQLGGKCVKCNSKRKLEIDHIDPTRKSIELSRLWGIAEDRFFRELQKCQVLCKKCHCTKSLVESGKSVHGTLAYYKNKGCRCQLCRTAASQHSWNYKRTRKRLRNL